MSANVPGFLVYTVETGQAVHVDSDNIEVAARVALDILRSNRELHVSVSKVMREYSVVPPQTYVAVPHSYCSCPPDAIVRVELKQHNEDGSVKNFTLPMMVGVAKFHP